MRLAFVVATALRTSTATTSAMTSRPLVAHHLLLATMTPLLWWMTDRAIFFHALFLAATTQVLATTMIQSRSMMVRAITFHASVVKILLLATTMKMHSFLALAISIPAQGAPTPKPTTTTPQRPSKTGHVSFLVAPFLRRATTMQMQRRMTVHVNSCHARELGVRTLRRATTMKML